MKINPIGSNQTEVETKDYFVLVSYKTPVAVRVRETNKVYVTSKKWSNTTSRHISSWLS